MALEDTTCCGLDEISGLSKKPEDTLLEVCEEKYDDSGWQGTSKHAFMFFTDTIKSKRGAKLADYIIKHKLGNITKPEKARKNPNTKNYIMVWIWSPNEKNLKAWWNKNK